MSDFLVETKSDGLHVAAAATLDQLLAEGLFRDFADNLINRVAAATVPESNFAQPLADLFRQPTEENNGLLAAFLGLDAEVIAAVNTERCVWPLPAFLSYRTQLVNYPPEIIRLPPLNPDGHYLFTAVDDTALIVRFDIHVALRVMGHIRLAIGGAKTPPHRLWAIEHRLNRKPLTQSLLTEIERAAIVGDSTKVELALLQQVMSLLREFVVA